MKSEGGKYVLEKTDICEIFFLGFIFFHYPSFCFRPPDYRKIFGLRLPLFLHIHSSGILGFIFPHIQLQWLQHKKVVCKKSLRKSYMKMAPGLQHGSIDLCEKSSAIEKKFFFRNFVFKKRILFRIVDI
jgi:hypothetical protein